MEKIKILGSGCAKCKQTHHAVQHFLAENNLKAELMKVEDMAEILKYNLLATPAVVIDEEVKVQGHVPSHEELERILL